jgi:hypothetical protein
MKETKAEQYYEDTSWQHPIDKQQIIDFATNFSNTENKEKDDKIESLEKQVEGLKAFITKIELINAPKEAAEYYGGRLRTVKGDDGSYTNGKIAGRMNAIQWIQKEIKSLKQKS